MNDTTHSGNGDPKFLGDVCLKKSLGGKLVNFDNVFLSHYMTGDTLTLGRASFSDAVVDVIGICSNKEMRRSYTGRVVALMKDVNFGQFPKVNFPRRAVGKEEVRRIPFLHKRQPTISTIISAGGPNPTLSDSWAMFWNRPIFVNFPPKQFTESKMCGGHFSLLHRLRAFCGRGGERIIVAAFIISILFCSSCNASAPTPPQVGAPIKWTWTAPNAVAGEVYDVYCNTPNGTNVLMNPTPVSVLTYTSATLAPGTYSCWGVAIVNGSLLPDSNIAVNVIPSN
jgi:hypothetical protein